MSEPRRPPAAARRLRDVLRYRFDNLLARGTWAVLLWLGVVTLLVVLFSSVLLTLFDVQLSGSEGSSWIEDFWQSLLRVFDPGTMAGDVGWGRRLLALLITIFGILIAGTLIGLIANGVEQRVEALRRGRSTVAETGHVVILGASSRLPVVVEQLALANRARRSRAIVVLASREPVALAEEVRAVVPTLHRSRLVVRSGDPARAQDLDMVGLRQARAVIVLADDHTGGDAGVIRAVLAVGVELGFDVVPIVAELNDLEAADSLVRASGGAVHPVVASQTVARLTAFALRQPGLTSVVEELLDFRGCDLYVREAGALAGASFGDSVFHYAKARPIGVVRPDDAIELNPDPATRIDPRDRLIVIADDRRPPMVAANGHPQRTDASTADRVRADAGTPVERLLLIGWNGLGAQLLADLPSFAAPGSSVEVVYDPRLSTADELRLPQVADIDITLTPTTSTTWQLPEGPRTSRITAIILLAYHGGTTVEMADSRTLLTLTLLRRTLDARGGRRPRVIVELRDAANVALAATSGADDFVVSEAISSRLIVQLAEQPFRRPIMLRLYAADGPSVLLVPAAELGLVGDVGFSEIIATAYADGLLALGWRRDRDVVLNPSTDTRVRLDDGDQIVAIG